MADNEGIRTSLPAEPSARSPKLRMYESLFLFNRRIDHVVSLLHGMQNLPFAEKDSLQPAIVEIEEACCDMNADYTEQLGRQRVVRRGQVLEAAMRV